jgi:hypothetical protein
MIAIETKPSELWTDAERRTLIAELSNNLRKSIFNNSFNYGHANDALERIGFIATGTREFLNQNRDAILNGQ